MHANQELNWLGQSAGSSRRKRSSHATASAAVSSSDGSGGRVGAQVLQRGSPLSLRGQRITMRRTGRDPSAGP